MIKENEISPWTGINWNNDRNSTLTNLYNPISRNTRKSFKTSNEILESSFLNHKVEKNTNTSISKVIQRSKSKNNVKNLKAKTQKPQFLESIPNQTIEKEKKKFVDLLGQNLILKFIKKNLSDQINPSFDILDSFVQDDSKLKITKNLNEHEQKYKFQEKQTNLSKDLLICDKFKNQFFKNGFHPTTLRTKKYNRVKDNDILIQKYNSLRKYEKRNPNQFYY